MGSRSLEIDCPHFASPWQCRKVLHSLTSQACTQTLEICRMFDKDIDSVLFLQIQLLSFFLFLNFVVVKNMKSTLYQILKYIIQYY